MWVLLWSLGFIPSAYRRCNNFDARCFAWRRRLQGFIQGALDAFLEKLNTLRQSPPVPADPPIAGADRSCSKAISGLAGNPCNGVDFASWARMTPQFRHFLANGETDGTVVQRQLVLSWRKYAASSGMSLTCSRNEGVTTFRTEIL